MSRFVQIVTTAPSRDIAESIAAILIERGLAACTQVAGPVTSLFRWKGRVEKAEEWVCSIKTTSDRFDRVAQAIREQHTYDVPEIIAMPIVEGDKAYLDWIEESLEKM